MSINDPDVYKEFQLIIKKKDKYIYTFIDFFPIQNQVV